MSSPVTSATEHSRLATAPRPSERQEQSLELTWEEPHPGQRLPHVTESALPSWGGRCARPDGCYLQNGGECRGGMAAKVPMNHRSPQYRIQRPSFVKRDIRVRKHPKTPFLQVEEGGRRKLIGLGLSDAATRTTGSLISDVFPRMVAGHTADFDSETDASIRSEATTEYADETLVPPSPSSPSSHLTVTGLSHSVEGLPAGGSSGPKLLGADAFGDAGPGDVYGWEAELERKLVMQGREKYAVVAQPLATTVRWRDLGARRLFQRVFSLSGSRATDGFDAGRRASMAN